MPSGRKPCLEGCTCKNHSKPKGAKRSEESKRLISEARIRYYQNNPGAHERTANEMRDYFKEHPEAKRNSSVMAKVLRKRPTTTAESLLKEFLTERYPELEIISEFPFGSKFVYDFAIPDINLFCEADGAYHNLSIARQRDQIKNEYAQNREWEVQRYTEVFLEEWKHARS